MTKWVFTDATVIGEGIRFYWKLEGESGYNCIDNPSIEWLLDFISEEKPYDLHDGCAWNKAFDHAIACAAEEEINARLKEKGVLTDDELTEIIRKTYNVYFPTAGKLRLFDSRDFVGWLNLKTEKVWKMKGE